MESIQDKKQFLRSLNNIYDKWVESQFIASLYQGSNYMNWGYWNDKTLTVKDACDNLVDTLIDYIPDRRGNILEVACGAGGVTRRLFNFYAPSSITAINISDFQLRLAKKNAIGCMYALMDATQLSFDDNSFDNIISVEAAFHFNTRETFFKEAYRVLRSGGKLVMSDILFSPSLFSKIAGKGSYHHHTLNDVTTTTINVSQNEVTQKKGRVAFGRNREDNYTTIEEYKYLFVNAGFSDIMVEDVTEKTWPKYIAAMRKSILKYSKGSIAKIVGCYLYWLFFLIYFELIRPVDKYILISARK